MGWIQGKRVFVLLLGALIAIAPGAVSAQSCFGSDVGAASTDRAVHLNWARAHASGALESALSDKLALLFHCSTKTDQQLADDFADLSVIVPNYVRDASCFEGDQGVADPVWINHRNWALSKGREVMLWNARWKTSHALHCMSDLQKSEFYADISVSLAKSNLR